MPNRLHLDSELLTELEREPTPRSYRKDLKILRDRGTIENGDDPLKDLRGAPPPPISKDRGRLSWS